MANDSSKHTQGSADDPLRPDPSTLEKFTEEAPSNLAFNLPFGLGKLFGLPGAKADAAKKAAAKDS